MDILIKRVYEEPSQSDGTRILIDRLWPRGLSKEKAGVDVWLKDIAPTTELRKWFSHDPDKWSEFKKKYRAEISKNTEALAVLKKYLANGKVTLVYGAKDEEYNDAIVLKDYLEN
jgi:uncharacterized protein YeaO (DUF488 family)